jgi:hypothetical protein
MYEAANPSLLSVVHDMLEQSAPASVQESELAHPLSRCNH